MTQFHNDTSIILDVTQVEKEARRMRALYIQAGLRKGWARVVAAFRDIGSTRDHGTSKA